MARVYRTPTELIDSCTCVDIRRMTNTHRELGRRDTEIAQTICEWLEQKHETVTYRDALAAVLMIEKSNK